MLYILTTTTLTTIAHTAYEKFGVTVKNKLEQKNWNNLVWFMDEAHHMTKILNPVYIIQEISNKTYDILIDYAVESTEDYIDQGIDLMDRAYNTTNYYLLSKYINEDTTQYYFDQGSEYIKNTYNDTVNYIEEEVINKTSYYIANKTASYINAYTTNTYHDMIAQNFFDDVIEYALPKDYNLEDLIGHNLSA